MQGEFFQRKRTVTLGVNQQRIITGDQRENSQYPFAICEIFPGRIRTEISQLDSCSGHGNLPTSRTGANHSIESGVTLALLPRQTQLAASFTRLLCLLRFGNAIGEERRDGQEQKKPATATQAKRPAREALRVCLHALCPRMTPRLRRKERKSTAS